MAKGENAGMTRWDGSPSLLAITNGARRSANRIALPGLLGMEKIEGEGGAPLANRLGETQQENILTESQKKKWKRERKLDGKYGIRKSGVSALNFNGCKIRGNNSDHSSSRDSPDTASSGRKFNTSESDDFQVGRYQGKKKSNGKLLHSRSFRREKNHDSNRRNNILCPRQPDRFSSHDPVLNDLIEKVLLKQRDSLSRRSRKNSVTTGLCDGEFGLSVDKAKRDGSLDLKETNHLILQYFANRNKQDKSKTKLRSRRRGRVNSRRPDDATSSGKDDSSSCRSVGRLSFINQGGKTFGNGTNGYKTNSASNFISDSKLPLQFGQTVANSVTEVKPNKIEFTSHAKIHQPKNLRSETVTDVAAVPKVNGPGPGPSGYIPQGFQTGLKNQLLLDFHAQNAALTGNGAVAVSGNSNNIDQSVVNGATVAPTVSLEDSIGIGQRIRALNGLNATRSFQNAFLDEARKAVVKFQKEGT